MEILFISKQVLKENKNTKLFKNDFPDFVFEVLARRFRGYTQIGKQNNVFNLRLFAQSAGAY